MRLIEKYKTNEQGYLHNGFTTVDALLRGLGIGVVGSNDERQRGQSRSWPIAHASSGLAREKQQISTRFKQCYFWWNSFNFMLYARIVSLFAWINVNSEVRQISSISKSVRGNSYILTAITKWSSWKPIQQVLQVDPYPKSQLNYISIIYTTSVVLDIHLWWV